MVPALGFTQCVLCCDSECVCVYYMLKAGYFCVWLFLKKIGEQRKSRPTRTPWPCWFPWSERRQGKRHKMKQDKNRSDLKVM